MKVFDKKPLERLQRGAVATLFIFPVIMLLMAGSFSSCKKKEENKEPASLFGKWKLEKEILPFIGGIYDYSKNNIVYEFHTNGILTVTGESDYISYERFKQGEYLYSILTIDEMNELYSSLYGFELEFKYFIYVRIGSIIYCLYPFSSKEMAMDNHSYSDCSSFRFKKINQ